MTQHIDSGRFALNAVVKVYYSKMKIWNIWWVVGPPAYIPTVVSAEDTGSLLSRTVRNSLY